MDAQPNRPLLSRPMFSRAIFWGVPLVALALALAYAFRPAAIETDIATIARGPLVATVADEGKTRIKDIFVLSAPIRGRALRIEIEAGDPVVADETIVAEIEPSDPAFLDVRGEAEAMAEIERAEATLAFAEADVVRTQAELAFSAAELKRIQRLNETHTVSERTLQDTERAHKTGQAALTAARATVRIRRAELAAAKARMLSPSDGRSRAGACACLPILAPVGGQILRVLHKSEGVVEAGEPLVEIGDPTSLEIVADFLSADAVRIEPGQRVVVDQWGGPRPLNGRVERIEPFGFTKVSALGIEEQRVNVVIAFADPPKDWARLRHGFQVEARVVLWEDPAALKAPLTALFREGASWAVFAVEAGRARLRPVQIGHKTDLEVEIVDGLTEGAAVVRYPNDRILPGAKIIPRNRS